MDVGRRAKQFAPFAALRGLDETIRQQEIIYEPKRDLSEEKKNELDMKLRIDDTEIQIQDICDLTGDVFETIEISC